MGTLEAALSIRTAPADPSLVERIDEARIRCLACGHRCPLPDGALGVCKVRFNAGGTLRVPWGYVGRPAVRSDREEAVLSCPSGRARLQLRHARVRPALCLLPELGDVAGPARSGRTCAARATSRPGISSRAPSPLARGSSSQLQRAAHHERMGDGDLPGGARRRALDRPTFPTATGRRRSSTTSRPGSTSTKSISRASTIVTTASSAAGSSRSWKPSAHCTRAASGWRS